MKGNLKSWVFMFAVAGVIALAAACGAKGDTGSPGTATCPDIGGTDLNAPATTITVTGTSATLACADTAAAISGGTTSASGCGNSYYSVAGGTWTLYSGAFTGTAGQSISYYSVDKACNYEAVKTGTF